MSRFALLVLLALAACTPRESPPTPAPADTLAAAPAPPASSSWVLTDAGLGAVRVGMTPDALRGAGFTVEEDSTGLSSACYYARLDGAPEGVLFMIEEGTLARIDVVEGATPTEAGDRIGDAEMDVLARHPGARVQPHKYTQGHYLVVPSADSTRALVFETDGTRVERFRAGRRPAVEYVEGCA